MAEREKEAATLVRVSTPGQVEGVSLDEQRRIAEKLCEDAGLEVVEQYREAGLSATSDDIRNRPDLQRCLRDATAGRFQVLAVYDQDRLARNMFAWGLIARELKDAGVRILTPRGYLDLDDDTDQLVSSLMAWKANREARDIYNRTRNGMRGKARKGLFVGKQAPFGYAWDKQSKRPVPIEAECEIVRLIFRLADKQQMTSQGIARELTRQGHTPREVTRWWASHVARILGDERYCGHWYAWKDPETGEEFPSREDLRPEPLVSRACWQRVQGQKAFHRARTRNPVQHEFLLSGLIYCAECGAPMTGRVVSSEPKLMYYACSRGVRTVRKTPTGCPSKYVPAKALDARLWQFVEALAADPEQITEAAEHTQRQTLPERQNELDRAEAKVGTYRRRLEEVYAAHEDGTYTRSEFVARRADAQRELSAWEERATALGASIADREARAEVVRSTAERVAAAKGNLDGMDLEARRTLLRELDFRIEVRCDDWTAAPRQRVYRMEALWAGDEALRGVRDFARLFDYR